MQSETHETNGNELSVVISTRGGVFVQREVHVMSAEIWLGIHLV